MSGAEDIGTARLDIVCDVSAFEAAINRATNVTQGMAQETARAFQSAEGESKKAQTRLFNYIETLGRTSNEVKLLQAAIRGVDSKVIDEARQRMLQHQQAVQADKDIVEELNASWKKMQATANAAANELKQTARVEMLEAQARAAKQAADAEELLRIKTQHAQQGDQFAGEAAEAALIRRRADAIAVFTQQLDELDAAEARAGSQKSFLTNLESQAAAIGKTRSELLQLKAAELGVESEAAPFIAKLREQEGALLGAGSKFNAYGKSAKEVQLALRGVPAQLTDIMVSLQGGQAPLTVLLQQGGQLRDMFGAIGPAISAIGKQLLSLALNPLVDAAAVAAVLVTAWYQGEQESRKLADAVAYVGNSAGKTAGELQGMAAVMATNNRTQHESALALAEVVQSGKFAADSYGLIAAAATDMQRATGQALDKTISQFASLRDDPVKAVVELNKETHFLTAEIFDQIKALQEQGHTQDAARVAQEAYANSVIERSAKIDENLGSLQRGWRAVANAAKAGWDAMLDIGRAESPEAKIAKLTDDIKKLQSDPMAYLQLGGLGSAARKQMEKEKTDELMRIVQDAARDRNASQDAAAAQEANDYYVSQQGVVNAHRDADKKTADEIIRLKAEYATRIATANRTNNAKLAKDLASQRDTLIGELQAEQAKRNAGKNAGIEGASAKSGLEDYKAQLEVEKGAIQNETQLIQAQYNARLVSADQYYGKMQELNQRGVDAEARSLTGQIAVLRARNVSGKEAIETQTKIKELEAQLARVRADGATKSEILKIGEDDLRKSRQQAVDSYQKSLDQENAALEVQFALRAQAMGMGQNEAAMVAEVTQAYFDQAKKLQDLAEQKTAGQITPEQYEQDVNNLRHATDEKVRIVRDGYKAMLAAQADWEAGLRGGLDSWIEEAQNVSGQMASMVSHDMDTIENAMVDAAETGKLNWKAMLVDMLKELEKFLVKQAMLKIAYQFYSAYSGDYSGSTQNTTFDNGMSSSSDVFFQENAKGGVYNSPSLSKYSNGIYNSPQFFAFAKGAGVFGEKGPEAIMPLTRDASGTLGVRAQMGTGGGGAAEVNINVTTIVNSDGSSKTDTKGGDDTDALYKQFSERMRMVASDEIQQQMRQGGLLWKMGVGATA